MIALLAGLCLACASETADEISSQKEIVSCRYIGLGERNGKPVVNLLFTNTSGRNFSAVFGSLRIIDAAGDVIQRTGFTYSRPFNAGEEKTIPAFAYLDIQENAMEVLQTANETIPMIFILSEVQYENGETVTF